MLSAPDDKVIVYDVSSQAHKFHDVELCLHAFSASGEPPKPTGKTRRAGTSSEEDSSLPAFAWILSSPSRRSLLTDDHIEHCRSQLCKDKYTAALPSAPSSLTVLVPERAGTPEFTDKEVFTALALC